MKKLFYTLALIIFSTSLLAQAPMRFNYQAVLRDDAGQPMQSEAVTLEIGILKNSAEGELVFSETFQTQTSDLGLINLQIGSTSSLEGIDWSAGTYFIRVSLDGTVMGTTQLLSVPFALHANTSADAFSGDYLDLVNTPDLSPYVAIETPQPGDLALYTTDGWQTIPVGEEGQVLRVVSGMPQWADLPDDDDDDDNGDGDNGDGDNGGGDNGGDHETGTVTDVQGNEYITVKIGEQWWMAENLRTSQYRNGDELVTGLEGQNWEYATVGAYAIYNNDENLHTTYGKLYNWKAVMDTRGLCPTGWSVPSDHDFKKLEMHLGMTQEQADGGGLRGTDEGGKMKSTGTDLWNSPNTGFTALPGGARSYLGEYILMNSWAYFWTTTEQTAGYSAWYRILQNNSQQVMRFYNQQNTGMSVRCVKDSE
jgi:uncharacterized protein (TIGR02145 family)